MHGAYTYCRMMHGAYTYCRMMHGAYNVIIIIIIIIIVPDVVTVEANETTNNSNDNGKEGTQDLGKLKKYHYVFECSLEFERTRYVSLSLSVHYALQRARVTTERSGEVEVHKK
jgi:hypothetical protein